MIFRNNSALSVSSAHNIYAVKVVKNIVTAKIMDEQYVYHLRKPSGAHPPRRGLSAGGYVTRCQFETTIGRGPLIQNILMQNVAPDVLRKPILLFLAADGVA